MYVKTSDLIFSLYLDAHPQKELSTSNPIFQKLHPFYPTKQSGSEDERTSDGAEN
jgi:hypothetical protein